ncbi:glycosyltransferase family 4 protein [Selenomonas ruminantium]|uniref:Glycosyltransferase involved in cell wall bisynthesis n=1 Tax=Selenomonas ruminantium TaxID=971 RepID=A0A1I0YKX2_SELRU|nr:glycosyltransferase family 4 protein [Selenomonas ruminantium]SFB14055.1 Glycosyltransferase involved in cell wall bisynthesis [Selenomonas ruminantium]
MKIIIFGVGRYLENRYNLIKKYFKAKDIVAFIDNKIENGQCGKFKNNPVYSPPYIKKVCYDYILIASTYYDEMKSQLLEMGVDNKKIILLEKYCKIKEKGILKLDIVKNCYKRKRVLFLSNTMYYDGASLAVVYAARAIDKEKYEVTIAVPSIQEELLNKIKKSAVNVIICPSLPYVDATEMYWIKTFDIAIVNTFQNIQMVCEISKVIPVLWWIHEPGKTYHALYENTIRIFNEYNDEEKFINARIATVTRWAADAFEQYYPNRVDTIMPLGIPDERINGYKPYIERTIGFITLGSVSEIKGQDVLVEAINMLPREISNKACFYIVGHCNDRDKFVYGVKKKTMKMSNVVFTGTLSRNDLKELFNKIDVVVCASREETLSIAVIEGMMYGKVCITTDATGVADFIHDDVDGFVVQSNNPFELAKKIGYVIQNISNLDDMRNSARNVYEKHFSMKVFENRLELEMKQLLMV